jgi:integrase
MGAITPELVRRWYAGLVTDTHAATVQQAATTSNVAAAAREWAHTVGLPVAATGRLPSAVRRAWEDAGRPGADPVRPPGRQAGRTVPAETYRLLRAVLNTAVRDGIIVTNPCHIAEGGHVRADERHPATAQQVATIADAMPARYRAAVLVAAWSGLRGGELFALRRRDVDTATGTIRVDRTMIELPTGVDFGPPKSGAGRRTVTLPPTVAGALNGHLARFGSSSPDALLFTTATERPVPRAQRAALLAPPKRAAGRPDLTWHDLRHTGMTLAAATGASLVQLQRRLGQSTTRAALIYQYATDDADRLLAQALDDAAFGRKATVTPLRRCG